MWILGRNSNIGEFCRTNLEGSDSLKKQKSVVALPPTFLTFFFRDPSFHVPFASGAKNTEVEAEVLSRSQKTRTFDPFSPELS